MLGSRDNESAERAGNILKWEGRRGKVTLTEHGGELYPVKEWRTQDIWSFLMACGSDHASLYQALCRITSAWQRFIKTPPGSVSGRRRNPLEHQLVGLDMGARFAQQ